MDISKLPKLSQTPATPAAEETQPTGTKIPPYSSEPREPAIPAAGKGAEAWISIILGLILLFMFPRIIQYLSNRKHPEEFEKLWKFSGKDGLPLPYTSTAFFLCDLALALFAAVLIAEGVILVFARKSPLVLFALILTVGTVLLNLFVLIRVNAEIGFQLWPAVAIAFGGYIAIYEWNFYKSIKGSTRPAR